MRDLEKGGAARDLFQDREDSRIRNYIGEEGVLKSTQIPLILALE
jgi:hypothetical protein